MGQPEYDEPESKPAIPAETPVPAVTEPVKVEPVKDVVVELVRDIIAEYNKDSNNQTS